jgi:hypothetical protein
VSLLTRRTSLRQSGLWVEQQKITKLQEKKPILTRHFDLIAWAVFRSLLVESYFHIGNCNAGSKPINRLTLCMILSLQWLFGRSDKKLESQVNGRRSIEKYLGPDMMNSLPAKPAPPI